MVENAIEHGNLEISYEEKVRAHNRGEFSELVSSRCRDPRFMDRKVTVFFNLKTDAVEYRVRDDGEGFDWKKVLESVHADGLLRYSGRGIILSSYFFDDLSYNEKGNEVRLVKFAGGLKPERK